MAAVVAGAIALLGTACTDEGDVLVDTGSDSTGVSVTGRGEIVVIPDTGRFTVGVEIQADTVAEAREGAATAAASVIASVKGNGVEDRDVQTVGLAIYPVYEYPRDGGPRLVGYVVTNTVAVTVRDLERFSEVIDDAIAAGGDAVRLGGIGFDVSDRTAAIEDAREAAVADARERAEQLVAAAGVELGDALSIVEVSSPPPAPEYRTGAKDAAADSTPIEPGSTTISVSVQVRWAIR